MLLQIGFHLRQMVLLLLNKIKKQPSSSSQISNFYWEISVTDSVRNTKIWCLSSKIYEKEVLDLVY